MVARSPGLVSLLLAAPAVALAGPDAPPTPAPPPAPLASDAPDAPYVPPELMTALPALPASVDASAAWRLDLAEALRLALRGNLGIAVEREQVQAASLGETVAAGPFEPVVGASYDHGRSDTPPLTLQEGGAGEILTSISDQWKLSLAQRLSTGMQLGVDFTGSRARSSAGTAVEPLTYRQTLTLSVSQPLLRGFSLDRVVPRIDVLRARLASRREVNQLAITASDVVEKTEAAYWDLVRALYRYDVELRSQQLAEEQMALTRRQIDAGTTPPSDLIAAESTLAQRRLALVQAEEGIEQASDQLRGVLHLPRDRWSRPILPTDLPSFAPETSAPDEALALALKNRPEVAQLDLDLRAQQLAVRKAQNDQLPQLDLGLSASLIGQHPTYQETLGEVGSGEGKAYAVLLNLTWTPLRRATAAAAEIERTRERIAVVHREQAVQDIWLAVRDAVRNQRTAAREVLAAAKFRELSTRSLEIEQRKFLTGSSSNFFVAQRQEELANAQLAEIGAVLNHKKATAALLRATGQLLDARQIVLDLK